MMCGEGRRKNRGPVIDLTVEKIKELPITFLNKKSAKLTRKKLFCVFWLGSRVAYAPAITVGR